MDGFDYMEFIIPGLIMMAVITNSYANVVSSFYGSKFQRHIEEMLISPTPNYIILIGYRARRRDPRAGSGYRGDTGIHWYFTR